MDEQFFTAKPIKRCFVLSAANDRSMTRAAKSVSDLIVRFWLCLLVDMLAMFVACVETLDLHHKTPRKEEYTASASGSLAVSKGS
jgi:hypothetical protein